MLKQIGPLLLMALKTLPQRRGSSGVVVLGIAGVVAVLVTVLAIAAGVDSTFKVSGRNDTVVLMSTGSDGETDSAVPRADYEKVASMPEVARAADGKPLSSAEIVTVFPARLRKSGDEGNVSLRGIGPRGFLVHPSIHLSDGRSFRPGLREMIVGSGVASQFLGFSTGERVRIGSAIWTVTGHFTSHDIHDSEVLGDADTVQSAMDNGGYYSAIYVRLQGVAEVKPFEEETAHDPTLHLQAQTESQYFEAQSRGLYDSLTTAAYVVGAIMAMGALFGAIHSFYICADARRIEMATLRAIGFGSAGVMITFVIEALALALLGGLIGAALSWVLFNGGTVSTINGGLSQVVFKLHVSARLIAAGMVWACAIGLLGAWVPALRASRLPVAQALRR